MGHIHIKICILGPAKVGKSTMVSQLLGKPPDESYTPSMGETHTLWLPNQEGKQLEIEIFDAPGYLWNAPCRPELTVNTDGYVVMYADHCQDTFDQALGLLEKLKNILGSNSMPIILVANHWSPSQGRKVDEGEKIEKAKREGVKFKEISATNNDQAFNILKELVSDIGKRKQEGDRDRNVR